MINYYDKNRFISKRELARLADVSPRTFCRYLASRRHILTAMGISPKAQKLRPRRSSTSVRITVSISHPISKIRLPSSPPPSEISSLKLGKLKKKEKKSWNIGQSRTAVSKDVVILHSERETPFRALNTKTKLNFFMVRYILQQIKITSSKAYGKWYAKNVVEETIDLDGLSEHMSHHNSPYSKGVIKGLLTDMIQCIKELLLQGMNVKIDDLAIFSLGIKNKLAAATEEDFTVSKNIDGVKLKARATGELMSKSLNLDATLKKATFINGKITPATSGESDNPSTGPSTSSGTVDNGSGTSSGSGIIPTPTDPEDDQPGGGD